MDSSPADSSTAAANKRKRVSRACDACFAKKDRCDGARPLCRVCKNLDRACTYNRPERKRGPSQGIRQRLEGQIESLESMLGYLVDSYPHLSMDAVQHLRLDEAEAAMLNSPLFQTAKGSFNTSSPTSISTLPSISVYPNYGRPEARQLWRTSSLAKAVAPSLNLSLSGDDDEEDADRIESIRSRIDEARAARSRMRGAFATFSPAFKASQQMEQPVASSSYAHPTLPGTQMAARMPYSQQPSPTHARHSPFGPQSSPKRASSRLPQQQNSNAAASHYHQPAYSQLALQQRPPLPLSDSQYPYMMRNDQSHSAASYPSPQPTYHQVQPAPQAPVYPDQNVVHTPTSQPHDRRFEEETEALAYALGLTQYSSHPRRNAFNPPGSVGGNMPATPHSTTANFDASDSHYDLNAMDQHLQTPINDDSDAPQPSVDFFSEYDLNMPSNNSSLSVLHQLGLQGDFGLPASLSANGPERGDNSGQAGIASLGKGGTSGDSGDHHHTPSHWLQQPIRGIN